MKTTKTLLAGLLATCFVSVAHAQTNIRVTGSTAFRSNTLTAILNIMDTSPAPAVGFDAGTYSGSTYAVVVGNIGTVPVRIKTHFSGSEGGNQTVSASVPILFYTDATADALAAGTTTAIGTPVLGGSGDNEVPDVGMSDTFQSSSFFFGTYFGTTYPTLNASATTPGLVSQIVGIVQFKWCAGRGAPAGLANMTSQLARNLYGSGTAALALWSGLSTDHGTKVYAIGRDFDSGTRLTSFAESGLGAKAVVKQYFPYDSSNVVITTAGGTVDHLSLTPAGAVNGIPYGTGNGGYASGGSMSKGMNNTSPAASAMVGYLGIGDADGQIGSPGLTELSYNGVTLGKPENTTLISEGAYTFWGYEHLYYRDATVAAVKTVADTLALQIYNTDAPLPHYPAMQVSRATDGAVVIQKY